MPIQEHKAFVSRAEPRSTLGLAAESQNAGEVAGLDPGIVEEDRVLRTEGSHAYLSPEGTPRPQRSRRPFNAVGSSG
jgi:hypothetical protein